MTRDGPLSLRNMCFPRVGRAHVLRGEFLLNWTRSLVRCSIYEVTPQGHVKVAIRSGTRVKVK